MKNKVTFLGLIIITMIIGVSLTSCGGVEAALEGEWEADALLGYSIVIGKDSFTQKALGIESKLGDKVSASNGKITVKPGQTLLVQVLKWEQRFTISARINSHYQARQASLSRMLILEFQPGQQSKKHTLDFNEPDGLFEGYPAFFSYSYYP